ncbi:MAG: hypothetical protein WCB02_00355 [Bradyrhizobium sp.]
MSSGRYCLIRDLGLVKGGKGLKHHEVVVDFTPRGLLRAFAHLPGVLSRLGRFNVKHDSQLSHLQRHRSGL